MGPLESHVHTHCCTHLHTRGYTSAFWFAPVDRWALARFTRICALHGANRPMHMLHVIRALGASPHAYAYSRRVHAHVYTGCDPHPRLHARASSVTAPCTDTRIVQQTRFMHRHSRDAVGATGQRAITPISGAGELAWRLAFRCNLIPAACSRPLRYGAMH